MRAEAELWEAVLGRDRGSDGAFVYAVRTTGIYCRPVCPSRRPKRGNVEFFALPAAAESAGYRACRRCRPEVMVVSDPGVEMVQQACRALQGGVDGVPTLDDLSGPLGVSPRHLHRTFKRLMGITPRQFAEARRLQRAKKELRRRHNVTDALYEAGYGSSSRLYERADDHLGMTPASYGKGGEGAHISFTVVECGLGRLLVAGTERGLCAVYLGSDDTELEGSLRREFSAAQIVRDSGSLQRAVQTLLDHLDGWCPNIDLPVDLRATAFQWRVWRHLCILPWGVTRTYSEVAAALGNPAASRAVAQACARNPVALVIPCHRVLRKDGGLGGYRWGLERKQQLLARESAAEPQRRKG